MRHILLEAFGAGARQLLAWHHLMCRSCGRLGGGPPKCPAQLLHRWWNEAPPSILRQLLPECLRYPVRTGYTIQEAAVVYV